MATRDSAEAEIEREKRLVTAIITALNEDRNDKLDKVVEVVDVDSHEEHHIFIQNLKESDSRYKKLRDLIIEKLVTTGGLGLAVFIAMAVWDAFKHNLAGK